MGKVTLTLSAIHILDHTQDCYLRIWGIGGAGKQHAPPEAAVQ